MIFSTTSGDLVDHAHDSGTHLFLLRQLMYAGEGLLLATVVYLVGWHRWLRWSPLLLLLFTVVLAAIFLPGVGRTVNGARRWLSVAGFSLQPSEFIKYLIPLYLIEAYRRQRYLVDDYKGFLRLTVPLVPALLLIFLEPNNGTVAILLIAIIVLLFLMGVAARYWALPLLLLFATALTAAYTLPYVSSRLEVYWHPERDLLGRGHQPFQAKIAAGSGTLFGKGPGNSWQKLSYLPEAQNDYIAAIFAEEFGFLGIFLLLLLYMAILTLMGYIAILAEDRAALYLMVAILTVIGTQTFLNLAVVSSLAPSMGLNLPFFSQGGSSLMANMAAVGLFFSAAKVSRSHTLLP